MVTAIIVDVIYGKKILSLDDPYVISAEKAAEGTIIATIPGAFWIEWVPILTCIPSWFPGAHFKRFVEEYLPFVQAMRDKPFTELKEAMVSAVSLIRVAPRLRICLPAQCHGTAPECLARTLVESVQSKYGGKSEEPFYDEVARNVAGIAYGGKILQTLLKLCSYEVNVAGAETVLWFSSWRHKFS